MPSSVSAPALRGRRTECEALDQLVATVRAGSSQVLVLRGEAGVGKSALLEYLVGRASGCRCARAAGVESEMELAFAGLHQLCAPFLDRVERLPEPQREALATAFGMRGGDAPDRFLVGLAVLSLLCDVAEERPLVCVVDDAQWLDRASAQALSFLARRLQAEPLGLVFAVRESGGERELPGLPELVLGGLADDEARALLDSVVTGPLDEGVRNRFVAETRGNPLALLELPRGMAHEELAGGFGLPGAAPLPSRIEESFRRRLAPLPEATRKLMLVAAAEPVGDPLLVWRAAERLGVGVGAGAPAAEARLLELGVQVRFRHPLVRSAVNRGASPEERQAAHRALAEATDPETDPDRRAWHRAQATPGLDEDVAAELERSADRARARGGMAAAAAFHERAAELTPDPARRAHRALAAAQGKHDAGAPDAALQLLAMAESGPLSELDRARAELLRARIAFAVTRGRDAPPLLLKAARRLEPLDATLARETYLDAYAAAFSAGRLAEEGGVREVAEAVLAADRPSRGAPRAADLLLEGVAVLTTEGYPAGAPALHRALAAFRDEPMAEEDALRWLWLACRVARAVCDDVSLDELSERQVRLARRAGALALLPSALNERFGVQLVTGNLMDATATLAEADAVIEATHSRLNPGAAIWLAVWRRREAEVDALIEAARQDVLQRGEGLWITDTEWTRSILLLGLGRYQDALAAADRAAERPSEAGLSTWASAELIEAAVRSGNAERAVEPLRRLEENARACGTDWALGLAARAGCLLAEGEEAERLHRESVERLGRTRIRVAHARAHLLYGEWLRREGRRVDAREQLRTAHRMFVGMGNEAWGERARRELVATGETARKRTADTLDDLTPQEVQIARLAAEGHTNPEIGAQLFISPRTVEWHLHKVFSKLDISSRRQLRRALPTAVPA
ncbi:MAG TPA: AAA family ATPase [Solirubrobacteraceae bacterium]|jgi:DNA-binding CsgD family transcriptional regulator